MICEECRTCPIEDLCDEADRVIDERLSLDGEHDLLLAIYEKGGADAIKEIYAEVVYIENSFRSKLLNTSQEDNLIEWVDLNGKLMAITTIKQLIGDKLKEQK